MTPGEKRFLAGEGHASAATELAETLYKIPVLLTTWTRCGKAGCRCNAGQLHGPYHALHWREGRMQRRRYVPPRDVPAVRAILDRRRAGRAAERAALAGDLAVLRRLSALRRELDAMLAERKERP